MWTCSSFPSLSRLVDTCRSTALRQSLRPRRPATPPPGPVSGLHDSHLLHRPMRLRVSLDAARAFDGRHRQGADRGPASTAGRGPEGVMEGIESEAKARTHSVEISATRALSAALRPWGVA